MKNLVGCITIVLLDCPAFVSAILRAVFIRDHMARLSTVFPLQVSFAQPLGQNKQQPFEAIDEAVAGGQQEGKVLASAEKRHLRLRRMYSELKHLN
jgi:hypothetical protein